MSSFLVLLPFEFNMLDPFQYRFQSELNIEQFCCSSSIPASPYNIHVPMMSFSLTTPQGVPLAAEIIIKNILLVTSCSCFLYWVLVNLAQTWCVERSIFLKNVFIYLLIVCSQLKQNLHKTSH